MNTQQDWKTALHTAKTSKNRPELTVLGLHPETVVRHAVAQNTNTPHKVLDALKNDKSEVVIEAVAANANTHPLTLNTLSQHESLEVLLAVAKNHKTPLTVLKRLLNNKRPDMEAVKSHIYKNPTYVRFLKESESTSATELAYYATHEGYIYWVGQDAAGKPLYNITPMGVGSPPLGGYYSSGYIVQAKGVRDIFKNPTPEIKALQLQQALINWAETALLQDRQHLCLLMLQQMPDYKTEDCRKIIDAALESCDFSTISITNEADTYESAANRAKEYGAINHYTAYIALAETYKHLQAALSGDVRTISALHVAAGEFLYTVEERIDMQYALLKEIDRYSRRHKTILRIFMRDNCGETIRLTCEDTDRRYDFEVISPTLMNIAVESGFGEDFYFTIQNFDTKEMRDILPEHLYKKLFVMLRDENIIIQHKNT